MPSKKELLETIETLEAQHQSTVATFQSQLATKDEQHAEAIAKKSEECASLLGKKVQEQLTLKTEHGNIVSSLEKQHSDQIQVLEQQLAKQIAESTAQITAQTTALKAKDAQIVEIGAVHAKEISAHKKENIDEARAHANEVEATAKNHVLKYQEYAASLEELRRNHSADKAMKKRIHQDLEEKKNQEHKKDLKRKLETQKNELLQKHTTAYKSLDQRDQKKLANIVSEKLQEKNMFLENISSLEDCINEKNSELGDLQERNACLSGICRDAGSELTKLKRFQSFPYLSKPIRRGKSKHKLEHTRKQLPKHHVGVAPWLQQDRMMMNEGASRSGPRPPRPGSSLKQFEQSFRNGSLPSRPSSSVSHFDDEDDAGKMEQIRLESPTTRHTAFGSQPQRPSSKVSPRNPRQARARRPDDGAAFVLPKLSPKLSSNGTMLDY